MTIDTKKLAELEGVDAEGLDAPAESAPEAEPSPPKPPQSMAAQAQALHRQGMSDEAIAEQLKLSVGHVLELLRPVLKARDGVTVLGEGATIRGVPDKRRL